MPASLVLIDYLILFEKASENFNSMLTYLCVFVHLAVLLIMYHVIDRNRTQRRIDAEYYNQLRAWNS